MMLFRIENQYYYGFKISESDVHRLKEIHLEQLKDAIYQKGHEITQNMTRDFFVNL